MLHLYRALSLKAAFDPRFFVTPWLCVDGADAFADIVMEESKLRRDRCVTRLSFDHHELCSYIGQELPI